MDKELNTTINKATFISLSYKEDAQQEIQHKDVESVNVWF